MKAVAVALKQERALVEDVSVIVQLQTSRRFVWSSSLGHAAIDGLRQRVLVRRLGVRQVVHGDGEEDVEEDVVTADEQEDEVDADQAAETLEMLEIIAIIIYNLDIIYIYLYAAICLDPIIHDYIPILSGQNLTKKRFKLNASSEIKRIFYNTSNFKLKSQKTCITSTFSALPCKQGKWKAFNTKIEHSLACFHKKWV